MSYFLIDAEGNVRDIASNVGLEELRKVVPEPLAKLLDEGEGDEVLVGEIVEDSGTPDYIVEILRSLTPPVTLTNGIDEDEEVE